MRIIVIILAVLGLATLFSSLYIVDQHEKAIRFQFGEIKETDIGPGLHFKAPFFTNNIRFFDARVLTMDSPPELFLTAEKKNVRVDFFVKWRIDDLDQYFRATRGNDDVARNRLTRIMKASLRDQFAKRTVKEAISGERNEIMEDLRTSSNVLSKELGIEVIDTRVSRIDLPDNVSSSVYERMAAERARVAADLRARGREEAEKIQAGADKQATVILANAQSDAEKIRGEGDAKSTEIYAGAYNRDKNFYSFYRSLEAYRKTFNGSSSIMLLEPDSDFFRYFNSPSGK